MRKFYSFVFLLYSSALLSQNAPYCLTPRYENFSFLEVDTTDFVRYGGNATINGTYQDLFMTVYEPKGDTATQRPLILLAFGGSFVSGDRYQVAELCEAYARMGYVAASIDYRLYDGAFFPIPDSLDIMEEVIFAIHDMKAAVRYFYEDAATRNEFAVDTQAVFVGGFSAGAITACHVGFLDNSDAIPPYIQSILALHGGLEGNSSQNLQYGSQVRGVLNMSGALHRSTWIDANDPALFSVHESGDPIVPYGFDFVGFSVGLLTFDVVSMEGSSRLHTAALQQGLPSELITYNANTHVNYVNDSLQVDSLLHRSARFMKAQLCTQIVSTQTQNLPQTKLFPNPATQYLHLQTESQSLEMVRVFDMQGRLYQTFHKPTQHLTLEVQDWPTGMYIIQCVPKLGRAYTQKVWVHTQP